MLRLALVPLQAGGEGFGIDPRVALITFVVLLLAAIGIGYWVYKDASKRDNNEYAWAIGIGFLFFLVPLIGIGLLILYFILRGDETSAEPVQDGTAGDEW